MDRGRNEAAPVKKPLEKIFVTEIRRVAEIARPTFYYHFQDKYDLMAWIFCQRTRQTDAQTRFSIRLYCYGTLGMTREWLMNDNITPAETVVRMMFGSMPEDLRRIFFWKMNEGA